MMNRGEHAIAAETLANGVAVTSEHACDRGAASRSWKGPHRLADS
jgi:hypothetical protein